MTQITLIVASSKEIGNGHYVRSSELAKSLKNISPETQVSLFDLVTKNKSFYISESFKRKTFQSYEIDYKTIDIVVLDLPQDLMKEKIKYFHKKTKIFCLDWFGNGPLPDFTINLIDHSKSMAKRYVRNGKKNHYFEGHDWSIIRSEVLEVKKIRYVKSNTRKVSVLVTIGGSDAKDKTEYAIKLLKKINDEKLNVKVILGPLVNNRDIERIKLELTNNFEIICSPENFPRLLKESDLILCGGGTTLLEAIFLAKSIVVFPQTAEEKSHAEIFKKRGACVFPDKLEEILFNERKRLLLAKNAENLIDGKGISRIANLILSTNINK